MGKFTDRMRKIFNPVKAKQVEFNRSVGLNDDAQITTIDKLHNPHDAYFIRSTDRPDLFVKFQNGEYFIAEGSAMSCLWTLKAGQRFIDEYQNQHPVELVRMDVIIGKK